MLIILILAIASHCIYTQISGCKCVFVYVKNYQIVHLKYVQFVVYQGYLNKAVFKRSGQRQKQVFILVSDPIIIFGLV